MSTNEGEKTLKPEAELTAAYVVPEPVVDAGHEEHAPVADTEASTTEASTVEPSEEEPPVEAIPEEPEEKGPGFFARMAESTSPYTMLLWVALAALIAGAALLAVELSRYEWDVKAKSFRRAAAATLRVEPHRVARVA